MYCSACGTVITQSTKYCRQCGAPLAVQDEVLEKRFDEYLDGIFWLSVLGLGTIVGGAVVLSEVLHLGRGIILGYLALSAAVFLLQFGLNLEEILRMRRLLSKQPPVPPIEFDTNKLRPTREPAVLAAGESVVEETTRTLTGVKEPVVR